MPQFWKAVTKGFFEGQEIDNILYYIDRTTQTASFDIERMQELGALIGSEVLPSVAPLLDPAFSYSEVTLSVVDESNSVVSPFEVDVTIDVDGSGAAEAARQSICAILTFRVVPLASSPAPRIPKRSYLALGPVSETFTSRDGQVVLGSVPKAALELAFSSMLTGTSDQYVPVRVGRPNGSAVNAYGAVFDASLQPYSTERRSRRFRPGGA